MKSRTTGEPVPVLKGTGVDLTSWSRTKWKRSPPVGAEGVSSAGCPRRGFQTVGGPVGAWSDLCLTEGAAPASTRAGRGC